MPSPFPGPRRAGTVHWAFAPTKAGVGLSRGPSPPAQRRPPQALERYCRTQAGFSGIHNVYSTAPRHDNKQQSFFLAETLK